MYKKVPSTDKILKLLKAALLYSRISMHVLNMVYQVYTAQLNNNHILHKQSAKKHNVRLH